MNETHVTVMGNTATQVDFKTSASGVPVARFRLASTVRRYRPEDGRLVGRLHEFLHRLGVAGPRVQRRLVGDGR